MGRKRMSDEPKKLIEIFAQVVKRAVSIGKHMKNSAFAERKPRFWGLVGSDMPGFDEEMSRLMQAKYGRPGGGPS